MVRSRRAILIGAVVITAVWIAAGLAWPLFGNPGYLRECWRREASMGWYTDAPFLALDGRALLLTRNANHGVVDDRFVLLEPDGTEVYSIPDGDQHGLLNAVWDGAGNVYVVTLREELLALAPDGRELWRYAVADHSLTLGDSLAEDGCYVLVAEEDPNQPRRVQHLDFQGRLLDEFTVEIQATDITTGPGGIYLVDEVFFRGAVMACGPDGRVRWAHAAPALVTGNEKIGIEFIGDLVILMVDGYGVQALNHSGEIEWEFTDTAIHRHCINFAVRDDRIILAESKGMVYELDADGRLLWSKDTCSSIEKMFAGTDTIYVHAFRENSMPDWFRRGLNQLAGRPASDRRFHSLLLGIPLDGGRYRTWEVPDDCWPRAIGPDGGIYALRNTGASITHRIHLVRFAPPH